MKMIRELRMGLPKSFKTGATVGSYPKPMFVFSFDEEGLSVIPSKRVTLDSNQIKMDCCLEDIVWIKPEEVNTYCDKPESEQPKIVAIDFCDTKVRQLLCELKPTGDTAPFAKVMTALNALITKNGSEARTSLPWKTVVFDNLTAFGEFAQLMVAGLNLEMAKDMRLLAPLVGGKVAQLVGVLTSLPTHVVVLAHTFLDKDEKAGVITELPIILSRYRDKVGAGFSQYLYATKKLGRPILWTTDQMFVRGIGCRWPANLAAEIQPDFMSIYGKELI